jgi:hypothetical protein
LAAGIQDSSPRRSSPQIRCPEKRVKLPVYNARPKATPSADRSTETHDRVRTDRLDNSGCVTPVLLLVQDLDVRIVNAATGELLRELTIDPTRDYQGTARPPGPTPKITK